MTKYEAVRAKIVEACPDLMKLSFGCKVSLFLEELGNDETVVLSEVPLNEMVNIASAGMVPIRDLKILGHPIRLSHVLRAINKATQERQEGVCMTVNGFFFKKDTVSGKHVVLAKYDLTKDDLSLQSPETIDFLFKILCE